MKREGVLTPPDDVCGMSVGGLSAISARRLSGSFTRCVKVEALDWHGNKNSKTQNQGVYHEKNHSCRSVRFGHDLMGFGFCFLCSRSRDDG